MPAFPECWWNGDLSFTGQAELRLDLRGVTDVELRAMLETAKGCEPNVVQGRFTIYVPHAGLTLAIHGPSSPSAPSAITAVVRAT